MVRKYKLKLKSKQGGARERARSVPPKISKRYVDPVDDMDTVDTVDAANYQANKQHVNIGQDDQATQYGSRVIRDVERPPRVYEDEKGTYIMDGEKKKRIIFTSGAQNHQANQQTVNLVLSGLTTKAKRKPRKPKAPKLKPETKEAKTEEEKAGEQNAAGPSNIKPVPKPADQAKDPKYILYHIMKMLANASQTNRKDARALLGQIGKLPPETVFGLLQNIRGRNPLNPGVAVPGVIDQMRGDAPNQPRRQIDPYNPSDLAGAISNFPDVQPREPTQAIQQPSAQLDSQAIQQPAIQQPAIQQPAIQSSADASRLVPYEAKTKDKATQYEEVEAEFDPYYEESRRRLRSSLEPATVELLESDDDKRLIEAQLSPREELKAPDAAAAILDIPDLNEDEKKQLDSQAAQPAEPAAQPAEPAAQPAAQLGDQAAQLGDQAAQPQFLAILEAIEEDPERARLLFNNMTDEQKRETLNNLILHYIEDEDITDGFPIFESEIKLRLVDARNLMTAKDIKKTFELFKIPVPGNAEAALSLLMDNLTPEFITAYYKAIDEVPKPPLRPGMTLNEKKSRRKEWAENIGRRMRAIQRRRMATRPRGNGKAKSLMVGLYDSQIDDIMRGYPEYVGCISRDEIAKLNLPEKIGQPGNGRFGFVYNTVPSNKPTVYDGHWRAIFIDLDNDKEIDHYDSYGDPAEPDIQSSIKRLLDQFNLPYYLKWKDNRVIDQRANSNNCGYFATSFLMDRFAGKPFKDASGYSNIQAGERKARGLNKKFRYLT